MADLEAVTGYYGRWASIYDLVARYTPGLARIRARLADELDLTPGETVVEMGCGTGANLPHLRERVGESGQVLGIDLTPGVLEHARRRIQRAGWDNVAVLRGDAARPPIDSADAVLATFVIGMLDEPDTAVGRWCDRLSSTGRIGLLDARRTDRRLLTPTNGLFRAFVLLTAPPGTRLRYEESPALVLDRRVEAARRALEERCTAVTTDRLGLGFLDLAVGTVA